MELRRGQVVKAIAGHDQGSFFTVLEVTPPYAVLCDGKRRPLERPKRKKTFHVAPTRTVLEEGCLQTNKLIRAGLHPFNHGTAATE